MTTPWVVAFVAMAVALLLLAVLMLGLMRRVLQHLESTERALAPVAPGSARALGGGPDVGQVAPPLPAHTPTLRADDSHPLPRVVVFLEHGCEGCRVLAHDLRARRTPLGFPVLLIIDHPDLDAGAESRPAQLTVLLDDEQAVTAAWDVTGTPAAFVVDEHAVVIARGHPNTAQDLRSLYQQGVGTAHRTTEQLHTITSQREGHVHGH